MGKVLFFCLSALFLTGCFGSKKEVISEKIKIVSTTAQIGDLVTQIGGDRIESKILIRGDLDPHSYEIVKGDGEKLHEADLIFYNGLGLEHGASLSGFLFSSKKAISLGQKIEELAPQEILKKGAISDPHIWMDISLWSKGIEPIVLILSQIDPEGEALYRERGERARKEMEIVHNEIIDQMRAIPSEKRYLVTSHDAFHYFTRRYLADPQEVDWEKRFAAPEGLAPESQLKSQDIQRIIDFLLLTKTSVLFPESNVNKDSLRKIAIVGREYGLEIRICKEPLYGDAMSGLSYLEMMQSNARTFAKNL